MASSEAPRGRVLIVDDQESNVALLEDILDESGRTERMSVTDPRAALAAARAFGPDLVLLDLMMPHLDGLAVLALLRAELGRRLPVVMLTADDAAETKRRALAAGVSDFIAKPFDPIEVMLRIEGQLERRALERELEGRNADLERRVAERTAELQRQLDARGLLLRELNHRVRNNLSVLASMLNLQSLRCPDAAARRAILSVRDRVNAMSLAHEAVYDESLRPELSLQELGSGIIEFYRWRDAEERFLAAEAQAPLRASERIAARFGGAVVDLDTALPLALVLNEFLANALEHGGSGPLAVVLDAGPEGLILTVEDSGPGLGADFDLGCTEGFGLTLALMMAEQAGGILTAERSGLGGALFSLRIPARDARSPAD